NLFGNRRDIDGERMVVTIESREQLFDGREIILDQLAFVSALGRVAEDVECRAAQTAQLREQLERREHPGPVFGLAQAAFGIARSEQRRSEVEMHLVAAVEGFAQLPLEFAARVQ